MLIVFALVKIIIILAVVVSALTPILTWAERRQSAFIQNRLGPNRANIGSITLGGLLHPLADALKMLTKEDFFPQGGDKFLHNLAPMFGVITAIVIFAVIPFGPNVQLFGYDIPLQIAQVDMGILFVLAFSSLAVFGISLAGWSSNNKWAILGSIRASAQMISYEVSMGLAIMGIFMVFQSLRLEEIVLQQGNYLWNGWLPKWGIIVQPLGFILFLTASIAETKRTPFDIPEAESELVAGYFLEYSGMKFGMFYMAEFMGLVAVAAILAVLFLGGWQIPYLVNTSEFSGFLLPGNIGFAIHPTLIKAVQIGGFVFKVIALCWFQLLIRWTLPRFRYDQLMSLGWKILLPLALANIFITALIILW